MSHRPIIAHSEPNLEPEVRRPADGRPWERAALVALTLAIAALYLGALGSGLACTGDDGYYLMLGRSLWAGHGYREFWQVGHPWHRLYPPGYPLLLAPWVGAFHGSPWLWKLPGALAGCAIPPLTYTLARDRMRAGAALAAAAWVGLSPWIIMMACGFTLSEVPYVAASLATLIAIERARNGGQGAALVALAFLTLLLRTAGLSLIAAGAIWLLAHRRPVPAAALAAGALLFLIPWSGYRHAHRGDGGLAYSLTMRPQGEPGAGPLRAAALTSRFLPTAGRYLLHEIPYLLWPRPEDSTSVVRSAPPGLCGGGLLILLLAAAGLAIDIRNSLRPDHLYLPLFLLPLFVWPWVSLRLVGPLLPLLALYAAIALERLALAAAVRSRRHRLGLAVPAGIAVVLALAPQLPRGLAAAAATRRPTWPDPAQARVYALGHWIDRRLPAKAVIASIVPANLALVARQPMTTYLQTRNAARVFHRLARDGVVYLLVDNLHAREGYPFLENAIHHARGRFGPTPGFPVGPETLLRFRPRPADLRPDQVADHAITSIWMTQWRGRGP